MGVLPKWLKNENGDNNIFKRKECFLVCHRIILKNTMIFKVAKSVLGNLSILDTYQI